MTLALGAVMALLVQPPNISVTLSKIELVILFITLIKSSESARGYSRDPHVSHFSGGMMEGPC
jgi:hypothetical protein